MNTAWMVTSIAALVLAGRSPLLPEQGSRESAGPGLVISSTVRFSSLDGSAADLDGEANGIVEMYELLLTEGGVLVLDVPRAIVLSRAAIVLERNGLIGTERGRGFPVGPDLVLRAEHEIRISNEASIRLDGDLSGGSLFLCSKALEVLDRAILSANGGLQAGGSISASAQGHVVLGPNVRLRANGAYGGQVAFRSCSPDKDAVSIRGGKLEAIGLTELGGQIRLDATAGGIEYSGEGHTAVVFEATGNTQDGQVLLVGASEVAPILRTLGLPQPQLALGSQPLVTCDCPAFLPALELEPLPSTTASTQVTVSGRATAADRIVRIEGPAQTVDVTARSDRRFSADIALAANQLNSIFVAELEQGIPGPQQAVAVIQDGQGPNLFIDSPAAQSQLVRQTADVAGRVGDTLSGFMGLTVAVNGIPAIVDSGVGNNGTFLARDVPLNPMGATMLTASAQDALGNTTTRSISVTYQPAPTGQPHLVALPGGSGQTAEVDSQLGQPIRVQVLDGGDAPIPSKLVTFRVTRSNGRLSAGPVGGTAMFQAFTDGNGVAEAHWTLGSDAGCGNNRVEATSTQIFGSVTFCASALHAPARQINIGSGGNQVAEAGGMAPQRLRAWVSDSCNGVQGVPVTFRVVRGSGSIDGQLQKTVLTSRTGHAEVPFRLGLVPGSNLVEASFAGSSEVTAKFVVFGVVRDPLLPTSFHGVVVDNGSQPIRNVECSLRVGNQDFGPVFTADDGQFWFDDLPVSGPGHLHVDGSHADQVGGVAVPDGSFPSLAYQVVVSPNVANALPLGPIPLPRLNTANANTTYDADPMGQPTVLTVEGVEGLRMIVAPGSMSIDGIPAPSGTRLSLNQVNHDDVPMPMPDGAASPFAWTLQPSGAVFEPPIQIVYPNLTGLPGGAIAYFLNFNHETGRFEIIGSGHVSEDGAEIRSDPGVGVEVAGWGCNCPPYAVTQDCKKCNIKIQGPDNRCIGATASDVSGTYSAATSGAGQVQWTVSGGGATPSSGVGTSFTTRFRKDGSATVSASVSCDNGVSDSHSVAVTVIKEGPIGAVNVNLGAPTDVVARFASYLTTLGVGQFEPSAAVGFSAQKENYCCTDMPTGASRWTGTVSLEASVSITGEVPIPGLSLPLPYPWNVGLDAFVTGAASVSASGTFAYDACAEMWTGTAAGTATATISGGVMFDLLGYVTVSGGLQTGVNGIVNLVSSEGELRAVGGIGHNGLVAFVEAEFTDPLTGEMDSINGSWVLIDPSNPETFDQVIATSL